MAIGMQEFKLERTGMLKLQKETLDGLLGRVNQWMAEAGVDSINIETVTGGEQNAPTGIRLWYKPR